jgi:hypothetical protein
MAKYELKGGNMPEKRTAKHIINKGAPVVQYITKNSVKKFPIFGILTIIFVIAKIFDKLDWNWFLVFWPLWIMPAIILSVVAAFGVFFLLAVCWFMGEEIISHIKFKWRTRKRKGKENG